MAIEAVRATYAIWRPFSSSSVVGTSPASPKARTPGVAKMEMGSAIQKIATSPALPEIPDFQREHVPERFRVVWRAPSRRPNLVLEWHGFRLVSGPKYLSV